MKRSVAFDIDAVGIKNTDLPNFPKKTVASIKIGPVYFQIKQQ